MDVTVTRAGALDAAAMNNFFNDQHGIHRGLDVWRWLFLENPAGEAQFSAIRRDERILGTQCLMPMRFIDQRGVFLTAKSEETLLDPALRGQGAFPRMYRPLFQWAEERSINSIWGFTTAEGPFLNLGFTIPCNVDAYLLPLHPTRLSHLAAGSGWRVLALRGGVFAGTGWGVLRRRTGRPTPGLDVGTVTVDEISDESSELCERFVRQWGGSTTLRDRDYLTWRVSNNPWVRDQVIAVRQGERLLAWAVCGLDGRSILNLIDIIAVPDGAGSARRVLTTLIHAVINYAGQVDAAAVRVGRGNAHPFAAQVVDACRQVGFLRVRGSGSPVVYRTTPGADRAPEDYSSVYMTRMGEQGTEG